MKTLYNIGVKSKDLISFADRELLQTTTDGRGDRIELIGDVAEVFDEKYLEDSFISHVKESAKNIGIGENNIGIIFREIGEWSRDGKPVMTAFADQDSWDKVYEHAKTLGVPIGEIHDPEYPNYDFYLFDITI
jgi:hypothetical protein